MLELHERLEEAKTPTDRGPPERQIGTTDNQTDRRVYGLSELTEEEAGMAGEAGVVDWESGRKLWDSTWGGKAYTGELWR